MKDRQSIHHHRLPSPTTSRAPRRKYPKSSALSLTFVLTFSELKDQDMFNSLWQQWPWTNGSAEQQQQPLQSNLSKPLQTKADLQPNQIHSDSAAHNAGAMTTATMPVAHNSWWGLLQASCSLTVHQMPDISTFPEDNDDQSPDVLPRTGQVNWRKYGEKLLKGKTRVRAYFKCTHPDCEVTDPTSRSQRVAHLRYIGSQTRREIRR